MTAWLEVCSDRLAAERTPPRSCRGDAPADRGLRGGHGDARTVGCIALTATLAFGVLQAARDLGLDVPGDLSVLGYDDIDAADIVRLTTVHQPLRESGTEAVRRLLAAIDGTGKGSLRTVLPVHLVVRGTTGPPRSRL